MGEMTIRLDDALMVALRDRAGVLGSDVDEIAADILRRGLACLPSDRAATARGILASQPFHDTDTTDLIREDRSSR